MATSKHFCKQAIIVNELLCFVQCKFGNKSQDLLKTALLGFYKDIEIETAKDVIYDVAETVIAQHSAGLHVADGLVGVVAEDKSGADDIVLPTRRRRIGYNKVNSEAGDILAVFVTLDHHGLVKSLPSFVAKNIENLPDLKASEADIMMLAANMVTLKDKLDTLLHGGESNNKSKVGKKNDKPNQSAKALGQSLSDDQDKPASSNSIEDISPVDVLEDLQSPTSDTLQLDPVDDDNAIKSWAGLLHGDAPQTMEQCN